MSKQKIICEWWKYCYCVTIFFFVEISAPLIHVTSDETETLFIQQKRKRKKFQAKCIPSNSIKSKWYSRFFYAFSFIRIPFLFCFMCWISVALCADFLFFFIIELQNVWICFSGFWIHTNDSIQFAIWWTDTHEISFSYCFALPLKSIHTMWFEHWNNIFLDFYHIVNQICLEIKIFDMHMIYKATAFYSPKRIEFEQ